MHSTLHCPCVALLMTSAMQQECIQSRAGQIGGSATDLNFICKSSAFLNAVHECEAETCSQSDISRMFCHLVPAYSDEIVTH